MWWDRFVHRRDDMVGIDAALIMNPKVWEASGHLPDFTDPLVECKNCHERFRADPDTTLKAASVQNCGKNSRSVHRSRRGISTFSDVQDLHRYRQRSRRTVAYFRPETAQGMFVDFKNVLDTTRKAVAVRRRADRESVPERDHAGQFHFPHARVRADGNRIFHPGSRARRGLEGLF